MRPSSLQSCAAYIFALALSAAIFRIPVFLWLKIIATKAGISFHATAGIHEVEADMLGSTKGFGCYFTSVVAMPLFYLDLNKKGAVSRRPIVQPGLYTNGVCIYLSSLASSKICH